MDPDYGSGFWIRITDYDSDFVAAYEILKKRIYEDKKLLGRERNKEDYDPIAMTGPSGGGGTQSAKEFQNASKL